MTTPLRMIVVTVVEYDADEADYDSPEPDQMAVVDQDALKADFVGFYTDTLTAVDGITHRLLTDIEEILPTDQAEPIVIMPDGSVKKLIRGWGPHYETYVLAPR